MFRLLILVFSVASVGCAGTTGYQPPATTVPISKTVTVSASKDEAWKRVVAAMASSFFVINNIDKDSGFINLSYSGDPERYVDCGLVSSEVTNLQGTRSYKIPVARANYSFEVMNSFLYTVSREVSVEGRINLLLQEVAPAETVVTANVHYVVSIATVTQQAGGQQIPQRANQKTSFNTDGSGSFAGGTTCRATGGLEADLLRLAAAA